MLKLTNTKLVITGSIVEAYFYINKPLAYGFSVPNHNRARIKITVTDEESKLRKLESRKRSIRRAGSRIRKIVNANAWQWKSSAGRTYMPIFATFTFRDDIRDIRKANANFSHFIRRLNYIVFNGSKKCNLKYISVIEFQDLNRDGVVHYHVVFFNLPIDKTDILPKIWAQGHINVKKIDEIDNVGAYISKYVSSRSDDGRLDEHKHFFSSKGLLQPSEVREQRKARSIIELIPREYITKTDSFDGYQGSVKHVSYKLNKNETLFDIIPELNNLI